MFTYTSQRGRALSNRDSQFYRELKRLCDGQSLAVLSTCSGGRPYSSLVGFVASDDFRSIIFTTLRHTRKFNNIQDNSQVSILIDSRTNQIEDFSNAVAATAIGTAQEVHGEKRDELAAAYVQKHFYLKDFVNDPNCAIMLVTVKRYILVSKFQQVVELDMEP
jgi:nitroimidazol reductase NimA-like FMN-containing flavoprotein (pyridoxamine 5'-phosphate oxidase superfamily)